MNRYLALLAALLLSLCLLSACGETDLPPAVDSVTTAAPETEAPVLDIDIIRDGVANHTIVRPEDADQARGEL